jgi:hypothetical protein
LDADRAPQLKANVMWLRFSLLVLFIVGLSVPVGAASRIKLTDRDRATIVASFARTLFRPGVNYEGQHCILADGLRAEWIPKIPGYDVRLVTREELQHSNSRIFYYVLLLRPLKRSVHLTVTAYDSETKTLPHVILHYSYWRTRRGWRSKYLGGGGD